MNTKHEQFRNKKLHTCHAYTAEHTFASVKAKSAFVIAPTTPLSPLPSKPGLCPAVPKQSKEFKLRVLFTIERQPHPTSSSSSSLPSSTLCTRVIELRAPTCRDTITPTVPLHTSLSLSLSPATVKFLLAARGALFRLSSNFQFT